MTVTLWERVCPAGPPAQGAPCPQATAAGAGDAHPLQGLAGRVSPEARWSSQGCRAQRPPHGSSRVRGLHPAQGSHLELEGRLPPEDASLHPAAPWATALKD